MELESWHEEAHRQIMRLLALSSQRAVALAQYELCRRALAEELGVEPASETTALYERTRTGALSSDIPPRTERAIRGYELRERIGQGGFADVYRAYQLQVGRDVAIKIIQPHYANQPDFIRRFEVEAQLVARLEHPYIVPLYDYWREPDGAYLVMRWLRGGSLQAALERGPWKAAAAVALVDQIAAALATAHQQGIVHRDIKPANILLDEAGNAYLSDFGIAKDLSAAGELTDPGAVKGSPAYVSPEQVESQPVTLLADIYSLGVVLYELLTGAHPFPDQSLAGLLIKHLTEPLPLVHRLRSDILPAVDEVIQRATAKDPAQRYPDALALAAAFRQALATGDRGRETGASILPGLRSSVTGQAVAELTNPYKGLRPFQEADAADFFGREALTEQLLARLGEVRMEDSGSRIENSQKLVPSSATLDPPSSIFYPRFLAVVGPSGSGKSSVVRAGLIPAVRRGALPDSDTWFVVQMLPGAHPLEELEAALLRIAVNPPESLLNQMREDERGLLRAIRRSLPDESELLLVIDQFEEVFTLVEDRTERACFLDGLLAAVSDPRSSLRLIVTLRADFYDRPLLYPAMGELMRQHTEVVLPLSATEVERAIAGPAERVGVRLEQGLAAAILGDVSEQPGALPLLQYALTELFERREDHTLTRAAYQASGGVLGALARRADELYDGLDAASQEAARQLFLRLVTLGEGTEDTRRRVLRVEVEALAASMTADRRPQTADGSSPQISAVGGQPSAVIGQVIDQFGRYRLLSFDRDPLTRGPTVEVAHEALLREWGRLREWLDASRGDIRLQRLLATAATEWQEAGQEASFLLRGTRLDQFAGWAGTTTLALTPAERAYLEASLADRAARRAEEEARQRRELEAAQKLAETERQQAEEQTQAAQRLRRRALFLAGALVVAAILAVVAVIFEQQAAQNERRALAQHQEAEHQARQATSRELAVAAVSNLDGDGERSLLLALQAVTTTYAVDQTALPEALTALHQAIPAARLQLILTDHTDRVWNVAFSPDGLHLATASADKTVKIRDAATGRTLLTLMGHTAGVSGLAFSPDGLRLATSSDDKTARIWDVATGQELLTLTGHTDLVVNVAFSPDGLRLATASFDGTAKIWDISTVLNTGVAIGRELLTLTGHTAPVSDVAFSPDGLRLITTSDDHTAKIWDVATGRELLTLVGHRDIVIQAAFSPDGTRVATTSLDDTIRVWDANSGEQLLALTAIDPVGVTFSSDGLHLAATARSQVKVWDMTTEQELLTLSGHSDYVEAVAFSPDGTQLATASSDGTAKIWDATPDRELLTLAGHTDAIGSIAFSPDGTRLVTASGDGTAKVWDAATGRELLTLTGHTKNVNIGGVIFSPDGTRLATASQDNTAKVWDAITGRELFTLTGHTDGVVGVAFSPDGTRLATASQDNTAKIWDTATRRELFTLTGHTNVIWEVAFSPDGTRLATASEDNTAKVWDAATGRELLTLTGHTEMVGGIAFSPDGTRLATSSHDNTAKIWDAATGRELFTLTGHTDWVVNVAFSPKCISLPGVITEQCSTHLATVSLDGTAKIWDATTGQELYTLTGNGEPIYDVVFSPDGRYLATAGADGAARIYVLPLEDVIALARSRLTRTWTAEECQRFLHHEACPAWP
ncbi:MAG: protein kinase [Chloroflexi bacterium]|nr:protein kinase [Chloroflexota bacterium]